MSDPWGPAVPDHFKCGGGHVGAPLGIIGGGSRGGPRGMGEGGAKLLCILLCGQSLDSVDQARVTAGGV